ncbi:hypothetical protein ACWCQZ_34275 [Streptomyces sp. NPDC002285]
MTDEQSRPLTGSLTDSQRTRLEFAHRDLEEARTENLAQLPPAGLVRLVERLRMRLHDTLSVVDEISQPSPRTPPHPPSEHP